MLRHTLKPGAARHTAGDTDRHYPQLAVKEQRVIAIAGTRPPAACHFPDAAQCLLRPVQWNKVLELQLFGWLRAEDLAVVNEPKQHLSLPLPTPRAPRQISAAPVIPSF